MDSYKEITRTSYDVNAHALAEKFEGLLEVQRRREFHRFTELIPGRRMLDLGCGAGAHSAYFTELGLKPTCIDLSPAMVALARSKGLDAHVMDMEELTFSPHSFDGVWAVTSLLHIPKHALPHVLERIRTTLAPEGIMYTSVKEGDGETLVTDAFNPDTQRYFAYWREAELRAVMTAYYELIEDCHATLGSTRFLQSFWRAR